jgi:hypothetical protein
LDDRDRRPAEKLQRGIDLNPALVVDLNVGRTLGWRRA